MRQGISIETADTTFGALRLTPAQIRALRRIPVLAVWALGVFAAVFLINPGAGIFLEIPDNIPLIGNLDEAAATAILISCLAYFGFDLGHLFGRRKEPEPQVEAETVEAEVVEN